MAHKQKFDPAGPGMYIELGPFWGFKFIWGISHAVGRGCKNEKTDVLLVQYLLNKTSAGSGTKSLVTDGIFGRNTYEAVTKFQKAEDQEYSSYSMNSRGTFCHVDGRVDPYRRRNVSTKSKTVYTIILLNFEMADRRPQYYLNPASDPDLPIDLLQVLRP